MTTPLLPQSFWFRLAVACRRVDGLPRAGSKRLLDLPETCRLPQTALLDGKPPWAEVRVAWNPEGLGVAVEAEGKLDALADDRPEGLYGLQIWVDTRDTRDVSRATRFCHRFEARLVKGAGKSGLGVKVQPRAIARAVADAPLCRPDDIPARAERIKGGWRLELFLPAKAFNGFDPETNRRLGFAYQVSDPGRADEFLGVGREFPVGENPSLWSTLELTAPS
jgi:hypothetical protein